MIAPDRPVQLDVEPGQAFLVKGDEARLRQVIGNLMANALTHTPDGTPIEVRLGPGSSAGPRRIRGARWRRSRPRCWRSWTRDRGSPPSRPSRCSSASTGRTRPGTARAAATASAWPSSARWSPRTAVPPRWIRLRDRERRSASPFRWRRTPARRTTGRAAAGRPGGHESVSRRRPFRKIARRGLRPAPLAVTGAEQAHVHQQRVQLVQRDPRPPAVRERDGLRVAADDVLQMRRAEQRQHGQIGLPVTAVGGWVDEPSPPPGPHHVARPAVAVDAAWRFRGPGQRVDPRRDRLHQPDVARPSVPASAARRR